MAALIGRGNLGASVARSVARDAKSQRQAELQDLLARVEAATGADREIDCHVWALGAGRVLEWQGTTLVAGEDGVIGWADPGKLSRNFYTNRATRGPGCIPDYTASLDAALALVERVLPGCIVTFNGNSEDASASVAWATPSGVHSTYSMDDDSSYPTPALAILAALLKALIADTASPAAGTDRARDEPKSEPDQ